MFSLFNEVIRPSRRIDAHDPLIKFRRQLARSTQPVATHTLGAPSQNGRGSERTVGQLVRGGSTSPVHQRLLELLIEKFGCRVVFELGTSIGLTTLYLSRPKKSQVYTFEGNEELLEIAKKHFELFNRSNIRPVAGNIDATLPDMLAESPPPDMVYIDANHRYEATLEYTQQFIRNNKRPMICIIGDIYWSPGMTRAWKQLAAAPEVVVSIDLYEIGILFIHWEASPGHYKL